MLNHQLRQSLSIYQDNSLRNSRCKFNCRCRIGGRGNEDTLGGPKANQAPGERLNLRSSDRCSWSIAFCLNVNAVKSQNVLIDHAVDSTVAGSSKLLGCTFVRAAVTHCNKKIDDQMLEKPGGILKYAIEKIRAQSGLGFVVGCLYDLFGRSFWRYHWNSFYCVVCLAIPIKLAKYGDAQQKLRINFRGLF